ncbi:37S ribosomal protein S19, mitochondrial [Tolypocladium paradoxum]|uniref:37S ribosomal protein S19, mitochondrial n=1 Tax=Tolypocladium paradoxum TaxID=94208 RepID=A0A2S4KZT9_9HYPO|nr:37S ribosomal protein S19, mitochondrial [Tolypocladium paradoxum]
MQPTRLLLKRSVWKGTHPPHSLQPQSLLTIPLSQVHTLSRKNLPNPSAAPTSRSPLTRRPNRLPIVFPKKQGDKVPPVRTQARAATILPNFVGLKFEIHNGKDYHQVTITEDMVGHKLGEFSPTRKPNIWDRK